MASTHYQALSHFQGSRQVGKWAGGQKWVRQDSREGSMNRNTPEYCGWGGKESEGER